MTPRQKAAKAKKAFDLFEQFFVLFEELKIEIPWSEQPDFIGVYEAYDVVKGLRIRFEREVGEANIM